MQGDCRKLVLVLLFLWLNAYSIAWAQAPPRHFIKGVVKAAKESEPIVGATVILLEKEKIIGVTSTNAQGLFLLQTSQKQPLQLKVKFIGYNDFSVQITPTLSPQTTLEISLKENNLTLSAVEIIGDAPGSYRKLPGTATRLKTEDIQMIAPVGTQEALEYVPGVNGVGDDGFGNSRLSIGIRGLNPRRSARVLVLEDGVPIQPAAYVYPNMYYNPPVERLEEIEVIKGSGSIKYGPQTMGGVINYITRRPRKDFGGMVMLTGGTNGYASAFAEIGGWGNNKVHPELQLLYKRGDGYRENNTFEQINATLKTNIIAKENKKLYLKYNLNMEDNQATYTGLTEYSFRTNPRFNPKKNDEFKVFRTSLDAIYEVQINKHLVAVTKGYASYFDRDWWREDDMFIRATSLGAYLNGQEVEAQNYTSATDLVRVGNGQTNFGILRTFATAGIEQNYNYEYQLFGKGATLNIGGRYHYERFMDSFKVGSSPTDREGALYQTVSVTDSTTGATTQFREALPRAQSRTFTTTAFSFYAQQNIQFTERFSMRLGARVEAFEQEVVDKLQGSKYNDKTTVVVLPGAGFNFAALTDFTLFGGVHRGFTPPQSGSFSLPFVDNGSQNTGSTLDLAAEKSWNYELGFRVNKSWGNFEVAGFLLDIEDMVAAARSAVFLNLGKVRSTGLEAGGSIKLSRLSALLPDINFAYTYLQSKVVNALTPSHLNSRYDAYRADASGTLVAVQDTIDISGNDMPYAPNHTLNIGLAKSFAFGLSLRADFKFVSQSFSDFENLTEGFVQNATYLDANGNERKYLGFRGDAGPIPAYYLINLSASYSFNKKWRVFATVKNLLDNIYISSRLHSHPSRPEPTASSGILVGARRQINAGVSWSF
ncbi:iron(III) dicitrate TonB-dependent receptor, putative [Microscilla marina ATCC 23134]|uniref:Iron(III) dicitrate TonB-dependent receptor, putative n=2 Tax=Microscilla marina TaxID=1027 RepID=A1ZYC0_MICM2|nr:iron(III) dicitrate TonB-dependent receptor, putative [Microscilla marina ATCC 23134]